MRNAKCVCREPAGEYSPLTTLWDRLKAGVFMSRDSSFYLMGSRVPPAPFALTKRRERRL